MVTTEKRKGLPVWAIVLLTMLITLVGTVLIIRNYFRPSPFSPAELSQREERRLEQKLQQVIPGFSFENGGQSSTGGVKLEPTPYTEEGADRTVAFSEKELNALLAKNTDLADQLAVDLSQDLLSATLLVPLDPDFPVLGGKTVRIKSGMQLSFAADRLEARLKGVSVMGVPLPNDWLGGIKNVDLVEQFGDQGGFWEAFAGGIKNLSIVDGEVHLELKE